MCRCFFLNYYPVSLYKNFSLGDIDLVSVEKMITHYLDKRTYPIWLPTDGTTIYAINNFDSSKMGISDEELLYYYERNLKKYYLQVYGLDWEISILS